METTGWGVNCHSKCHAGLVRMCFVIATCKIVFCLPRSLEWFCLERGTMWIFGKYLCIEWRQTWPCIIEDLKRKNKFYKKFGKIKVVVYYDHQTGAPHAVWWSKSFIFALKQVFLYFSVTNEKKKEKRKEQKHNSFKFLRCLVIMSVYKLNICII